MRIRQNAWARLSGYTESTVSRQLNDENELPRVVKLAILAWERLTPDERQEIERTLDQGSELQAGVGPPPGDGRAARRRRSSRSGS